MLTVEPWPDPAVHPLRPPCEARRRELTGDESWSELDNLIVPVRPQLSLTSGALCAPGVPERGCASKVA